MILPVYLYGQPVLRKEAEAVPQDYPDLKQLIANMFETMYHADGVGLAGPQVGLSLQILVLDADVLKDDYPECKGFKRAMINPVFLEKSEEEVTGFAARVVQHECEHLAGHVFIDNISAIRRQLNKSKLNNIIKGSVRCSYRAKAIGK